MQMLTSLDMAANEILNAIFQNLTTAPANPTIGRYYYNTTIKKLCIWDGTAWDPVGSITGDAIIALINAAVGTIDLDNLPAGVNSAVTNSHTHSNKAILDAITAAFTSELLTKLNGIAAGAQVNTVDSVAGKTGVVTLTGADVGLSNVTNFAQVKKIASSTMGNIPVWGSANGDILSNGYGVETSSLMGGSTNIPRADVVKAYIDSLLAANDAMIYKGTLGTGGTITAIPTTYNAGWTYRVITAGTYAGFVLEIGDMLQAIVDRTGTGNLNTDWTAWQTNSDGIIIGPASSTNGNFPVFSGTTGKVLGNSSYGPSSFATADHTHSTFDRATSALTGALVISDIVIVDGIVTSISTRSLTPSDMGAAPTVHTHGSYDRATSALSAAVVFSDIVVVDGIITGISTRSITPADIGAANFGHTHDEYSKKYKCAIGGSTSVVVNHNLGSRDIVATVRRTASPYDMVFTDIEFTDLNTLTVKFAVAPAAGEYTITLIGMYM